MQITPTAPHDFYLTLDVADYFEHEYDPMAIAREGYARPLRLTERNVLAVVRWNERPEEPVFEVDFPRHTLTDAEETEAERALRRILGADLPLEAFYDSVADDPVLGPIIERHRGFRRLARADFFEEAARAIIRTRISHGPTKQKMVRDFREAWGEAFVYDDVTYYAYPHPEALVDADPEAFREFGISKRKGEYIVGMAREIADGELDLAFLAEADPEAFYERALEIRGIGPSTAQRLLIRRNRPDAVFPSHKTGGTEKGIRRWLLGAYDEDPHDSSEETWQSVRDRWRGYEALASQYLYFDWIMRQLGD